MTLAPELLASVAGLGVQALALSGALGLAFDLVASGAGLGLSGHR